MNKELTKQTYDLPNTGLLGEIGIQLRACERSIQKFKDNADQHGIAYAVQFGDEALINDHMRIILERVVKALKHHDETEALDYFIDDLKRALLSNVMRDTSMHITTKREAHARTLEFLERCKNINLFT